MIISSHEQIPLGRELCHFDREDASGAIVTYRNQPTQFLREATADEYLADLAERGRSAEDIPLTHGPYYYKVSVD